MPRMTAPFAASLALAAATALAPAVAGAAVTFTGTRENVTAPPIPNTGRCAPTYLRTIVIEPGMLSSTGTSNFGDFTASMSHCEATAAPMRDVIDGLFTFDFTDAGDSLFGTYAGTITPGDGALNVVHNFTVTAGTGRFLDASGAFTAIGTLRGGMVDGMPVGIYAGAFDGLLALPAVPEPSTWAGMVAGVGLLGAGLRRTRRHRRPVYRAAR